MVRTTTVEAYNTELPSISGQSVVLLHTAVTKRRYSFSDTEMYEPVGRVRNVTN